MAEVSILCAEHEKLGFQPLLVNVQRDYGAAYQKAFKLFYSFVSCCQISIIGLVWCVRLFIDGNKESLQVSLQTY